MSTTLILAIHNHQPVGNFDAVFQEATEKCYRPLLEILDRHPQIRLAMHCSGPLLEWLEHHHPRLIDLMAGMCQRGQLEPLGGGFYEPMLSVLPRADALGQIEMMQQYLEKRLGRRATGIWLTERVWEPELASLLWSAGVKYTLVDDTHFFYAGMDPGRLNGYYVTEKAGHTLAIFPIDKGLRYSIPFKPAPQLIEELEKLGEGQDVALTYGDDGEKFGIWPGTYKWVYQDGWLEDFLNRLEKSRIKLVPPGEYLENNPLAGRIYLPTASYEEMLEWALPASAIWRYEDLRRSLQQHNLFEMAKQFLRGGLWQNFMVKYPEANHMHKKMLYVSRKLAEAEKEMGEERLQEARRELYRGQCNCAYWHGLFGGLYLSHLRDAVYRHLIGAERIIDKLMQGEEDWIAFEQEDFDCDRRDEFLVENRWLNAYLAPQQGGVITEIDYRPEAYCLTNLIARRPEGYHREIKERVARAEQQAQSEGGPPASIHDRQRPVSALLVEKLVTDPFPRWNLVDRFPALDSDLQQLICNTYQEEGDFIGVPYRVEKALIDEEGECDFEITMLHRGTIRRQGKSWPLLLEKYISIPADAPEIRVRYRLQNLAQEALELQFCPELNFCLLAPQADDRVYEYPGAPASPVYMNSSGLVEAVDWFALADYSREVRVRLEFDRKIDVWRFPIETVSQSEEGFELNHQGSAVLPRFRLQLASGGYETLQFVIRLESTKKGKNLRRS